MAITKREAEEICKMIDEKMEIFCITPGVSMIIMTSSKSADLKEGIKKMADRRKSS